LPPPPPPPRTVAKVFTNVCSLLTLKISTKTSRTLGVRSLLKFSLTLCLRYVKIPKIKDIVRLEENDMRSSGWNSNTYNQTATHYILRETDSDNKSKNI
jgi:hypothetical protein